MKYDEIHRLILRNGWKVLRQTGSKEMGKGLQRKIFKDMDLL